MHTGFDILESSSALRAHWLRRFVAGIVDIVIVFVPIYFILDLLHVTNTAVMALFGLLIGLMYGADAHVPTDEENARTGNRILPNLHKYATALLLTLGVCVVLYAAYSRGLFRVLQAIDLFQNGSAPPLYAAGLVIAAMVSAVKITQAVRRKTGLRAALSCGELHALAAASTPG